MIHREEFELERGNITSPLTFSLFTLMNARTSEFFPLNPDDRSHIILLFQDFLGQIFGFNSEDLHRWMVDLIRLRRHLRIVENAQFYCSQVQIKEEMITES